MPLKMLMTLLMISSLVTSCSSSLKTRSLVKTDIRYNSRSLSNAPSCEETLEKCAKAVEAQKKAIKEQKDVIDKQDEIIKHAEAEVDRAHKATNAAIGGGISISTILLLLLLL
jgi:asparagine synthetase A